MQRVETRGINFAGEAKVSISTGTQRYKFRLSGQSKGSFRYVVVMLSEHPGEKHVLVSRGKSKSQ
ncbi:MAG: hypothetical protein RBT74_06625 [Tenuifilaceae bacterium]|nr:hypothetical protein [Tenuifilaceae bacterium]